MVQANKNYPGQSIKENAWKLADIEKEFRVQIETAVRNIPQVSHISSHMNCTGLTEEVKSMTTRLAQEYKIDIDLTEHQVMRASYEGVHVTAQEKVESFVAMLNKLEPGKTYLFVDHPGIDGEELRAIHHIGYENVAEDRQGVTHVFTHSKVKALIRQKGIQLIGYRDLLRK